MKENVGFRLSKIATLQFATIEDALTDKEAIQLNSKMGYAIGNNNTIVCACSLKFLSKDIPFIVLDVQCDFNVEPSDWNSAINTEKNEIKFGAGFLRHLAVLTIGTARGILHTKTENTKFNKYFLPTINVTEMSIDDMTFSLATLK